MGATAIKNQKNSTPLGIVLDRLVMDIDPSNILSYSGSGTVLSDLSGNGNDVLLYGATVDATKYGGSIYTTGNAGSHYRMGLAQAETYPNDGRKKTYCFWVEIATGETSYQVYADMGGSNNRGFWIVANTNSILFGGGQTRFNNSIRYVYANGTPTSAGTMFLMGVNYDPTNQELVGGVLTTVPKVEYFVNGIQYADDGGQVYNSYSNPYTQLVGGGYVNGADNNKEGYVSRIMLYDNKCLTNAEHLQNFNATKSRFGL